MKPGETDAQIGLFGGETPVEELALGPVQKLLAKRERELEGLDPLAADEAGAIVHAHRGKHSEDTQCAYCAVDGADALARLHARLPLDERASGTDSGPPNIHENIPASADPEPPL